MFPARTIACSIGRPPFEVYRFAANPANLPLWTKSFCVGMRECGERWEIETPSGWIGIAFVPPNDLGVLDHTVTRPDGQTVFNAMRVVPNAEGSEIMMTLLQRPGTSDEQFNDDAKMVEADFLSLKSLLEARSPESARKEGF